MPALESLGDGRLRHRGAGFVATVYPDGSVQFRDTGTTPVLKFLGVDILRFGSRRPRDPGFPTFFEREGMPAFERATAPLIPIVQSRFGGLADWQIGERNTTRKHAFLLATAELRIRMAYAWTRARLQEQLAGFGERLQAIWGDPRVPLAERKRRLFELWDECDEPGGAAAGPLAALRGAAAQGARAKLSAYVRIVAPEGSAQAFTAEELARLNAGRLSRARFDPYRDLAPAPPLPELLLPAAPPHAAEEAPEEVFGPTSGPVVTPVERADPPEPKASKRRTRAWPRPVKVKWIGPIPVLQQR